MMRVSQELGGGGGKWVQEGHMRGPCDGGLLYLTVGCMTAHMIKSVELHTHTHECKYK
jgi:hypothetical protein